MSTLWLVLQLSLGAMALYGARIALRAVWASDADLAGMAKLIGTRIRRQARSLCRVTVVPLTLVGVGLVGRGAAVFTWKLLGGRRAEPLPLADLGRHPGFPGLNVLGLGPGSALPFGHLRFLDDGRR